MFPYRTVVSKILLIFILLLLASCAVVPPVSKLPEQYTLTRLDKVSSVSKIAWHPDSQQYAVSSGGLVVGRIDGPIHRVHSIEPAAIAWSPTGSLLAISDPDQEQSKIRILATDDWRVLAEIELPGQVRDLAWRDDEQLVLASVHLSYYSFGGNYKVQLYHWRQNEELVSATIVDSSPLKSTLDSLGKQIYDTVNLQISPFRDEVAFTRYSLTPNAGNHYRLVVRNLDTGRERVVAKITNETNGGHYFGDGDSLFYTDGYRQSLAKTIWDTAPYEAYPAGLNLEISPGGRYKLIDRQLFKDRNADFSFDRIDSAAFSPDGSKMLFITDGILYLLTGLKDIQPERLPISQRLLDLRRWRSEELITPQEFINYVEQMENQ